MVKESSKKTDKKGSHGTDVSCSDEAVRMDGIIPDKRLPGTMAIMNRPVAETLPELDSFLNPFNHRGWLAYFNRLLPRFQYVRFLGLPSLKDIPDVPLERLYVPLFLASRNAPDKKTNDDEKQSIEQLLTLNRRLVILGDPGAGKSMLINYLITLFSSKRRHRLVSPMGHLIPLPFILRDFSITEEITFDNLLEQFKEQPFWPREGLSDGDLKQILLSGQGLILLDGLDEIGDVGKRKALRRAIIEQGIPRYPACVWVLTSRIVGYEEVAFDNILEGGLKFHQDIVPETDNIFLPSFREHYYILPFNDEQIRNFVERWYTLREADPENRKESVESLIKALSDSTGIESLSHNPNLLTMITLVHRIYARLPSGRALLYDKITEAYLESIDTFRGIQESSVSLNRHKLWLAALGFDMQKKRSEKASDEPEILISEEQIKEKMRASIGQSCETDKELGFIARRSGLLLPRKPGFYNFVHLSFQEYFAALHLYERLMSFDLRDQTLQDIKELGKNSVWHESMVFLFERLANHPGASDRLFETLFALSESHNHSDVLLAVELLGNLQSGLSEKNRSMATRIILKNSEPEKNSGPESNLELIRKINRMPDEIWHSFFLPELEDHLKHAGKSGSITPGLLLLLQNIDKLDFTVLEHLLVNTPLNSIKDSHLYCLFPLASTIDGPILKEMLKRMPFKEWFNALLEEFFTIFTFREISEDLTNKENLLIWCCTVRNLFNLIYTKIFLTAVSPCSDYSMRYFPNFILSESDMEIRSIATRLQFEANVRSHTKVRSQALDAAWAFKKIYLLAWDNHNIQYSTKHKSLTTFILWYIITSRPHELKMTDPQSIADLIRQGPELSPANLTIAALFEGDDNFNISDNDTTQKNLSPLLLIISHLARLTLGRGGLEDWQAIQSQIDIIIDPAWIENNLPFLKNGEMEFVLENLGFRMEEGKTVPLSEWVQKDHQLAPAVNAKPSQFAGALEILMKKSFK